MRGLVKLSSNVGRALKRSQPRQLAGAASLMSMRVGHCQGNRPNEWKCLSSQVRSFHSSRLARDEVEEEEAFNLESIERVEDEVDVCIVGGGPAGLSAAIKLAQLSNEKELGLRIMVLEKGAEIGAHTMSGAVIETRALDELIPDWKELGAPLYQEVTGDKMRWLTKNAAIPIPHPPQMSNKGNYAVSLSKVVQWLGEQAAELGVEIYPGFAGAQLKWSEDGKAIEGVITNEVGLDRHFQPKDSFEPGMVFKAKVTLFAEGAAGSLSKQVIDHFNLREGKQFQTYGLGIKEVWKVDPAKHKPGEVVHTVGYPLDKNTYGGAWIYHLEEDTVSLGLVVGLDYPNPYLSPFQEMQRWKLHPFVKDLLEGGERIAYGARALNEGGYQSIPKLTFPGGALIGCSAGFVNIAKIKGTHTAMQTGIYAAEAAFEAIEKRLEDDEEAAQQPYDMSAYQETFDKSWVHDELYEVRNVRPSFHTPLGLYGGVAWSGVDTLLLKGKEPFTFQHKAPDYACHHKSTHEKPIEYPKPDGKITFDILTSVALTGTNHAEDQPVHLHIDAEERAHHVKVNTEEYAGLLGRVCPAAVYEYIDADTPESADADGKRLVINSQNCIHCKTCAITVPTQDIDWRVPEGGGGPAYSLT